MLKRLPRVANVRSAAIMSSCRKNIVKVKSRGSTGRRGDAVYDRRVRGQKKLCNQYCIYIYMFMLQWVSLNDFKLTENISGTTREYSYLPYTATCTPPIPHIPQIPNLIVGKTGFEITCGQREDSEQILSYIVDHCPQEE